MSEPKAKMNVNIRPWEPDDKGYACLPLAKNLPPEAEVRERHPDWKLVKCPICGADCWESELARQVKKERVSGVCTLCAIKKGITASGGLTNGKA